VILNILWSSVCFVGFTLLAVFNRTLFEWFEKRRRRVKYNLVPKTEWNINQAFQLYDLYLITITVLYAIFAFNSALSLYKYTATIASFTSPDIVQTILSFYGRYIWPIFLFTMGGVFIYVLIQGAKNDGFLLPIWVINNKGQSLKIYISDYFVGLVEPGKAFKTIIGIHFIETILSKQKTIMAMSYIQKSLVVMTL
jgi:hypothetical protein